MLNVTRAVYSTGNKVRTAPLYQWDYGQILQFEGLDLPANFEAHFSNTPMTGTAITVIGNDNRADIPDSLLQSGGDIWCWVYLHDEVTDGETEYVAVIPVTARPKRDGTEPTPEEQDAIAAAIEALNDATEVLDDAIAHTETYRDQAEAYAIQSESWAIGGTDTRQGEDTDNAKYYRDQAELASQNASNSATDAETAQSHAESSATQAGASATQAGTYASQAEASATQSGVSATAASGSATQASQSATQSAQSATQAGQSAQTAAEAAQAATQAKDASQTAQGAAETAKTAAQSAQTAAEAAQATAAQSATAASGSATQAAASATAADASATAAATSAATFETDPTLSIAGKAADAKKTGDELTSLKSTLSKSIDVVAEDGKKYVPEDIAWINGYVGKDDGLIRSSSLSKTGIFLLREGQTVMVGTRNKNICCIGTTTSSTIAVGNTVTVLVKTSSVDQYEEHYYTAPSDMNIVVSVLASEYEVKVTEETNLSEMFVGVADIQNTISEMLIPSVNLADPSKFTKNKYMTSDGVVGNSTSYYYTNKIPVAEGDVVYVSPSPRYKTAFNGNSVVSISATFPWTVPSGVDGLIITGYTSSIDSLMITKGKQYPFIPYGDNIKNDHLRIENQNALNGNDGITVVMDTVEADATIEISAYPRIIAAHDRLSGYCEFASVGEILFGYGYGANKYCSVDDTNINIYIDGELSTSTPHGITITDYLSFSIIMDGDRYGQITVNSTGGTATATIPLGYSKNGLPFVRSTTALANVKLSAICKDIKNPVWWFGDSYSSLAPERIIGQLDNYGVIDNMLIDAVPGGQSYYNTDTGGYFEFLKLIKLAVPKYVVWALGMNDTDAYYKYCLQIVKNYCDIFGINLYAVKMPSVPNIDNTSKNAFIDELGIKSIDWSKAVNATAQGVWYSGYLSSDNVHPTTAGAKAMAARTIVDCPALMQF